MEDDEGESRSRGEILFSRLCFEDLNNDNRRRDITKLVDSIGELDGEVPRCIVTFKPLINFRDEIYEAPLSCLVNPEGVYDVLKYTIFSDELTSFRVELKDGPSYENRGGGSGVSGMISCHRVKIPPRVEYNIKIWGYGEEQELVNMLNGLVANVRDF